MYIAKVDKGFPPTSYPFLDFRHLLFENVIVFYEAAHGFHVRQLPKLEQTRPIVNSRPKTYRQLNGCQILHQENPFISGLTLAHGVLQYLGILGRFWQADHVTFQILHQLVVETIPLQDLEAVVPSGMGFEFEAIQVFIVVVYEFIVYFSVIEEMFECPNLA